MTFVRPKHPYQNKLEHAGKQYQYASLKRLVSHLCCDLDKLPTVIKILMENVARNYPEDIEALRVIVDWKAHVGQKTVPFHPTRVLMQDFTGVPAIVDLAAMRDAMAEAGGDAEKINPQCPVDLVIDHSVSVDHYGVMNALEANQKVEMRRNRERYEFLKWGQYAFENLRVVPPGNGICHQVNLEYLAKVVWQKTLYDEPWIFPDSLVGTDSHTTMINALGVLGWGVGGIEAEAAMLGQSLDLLVPEVVGVYLHGALPKATTATDLVLTLAEILRKQGVVGKFIEFYGPGAAGLTLSERATIANMCPEFGATCAYFPIDEETLRYLRLTGRQHEHVDMVSLYAQEQGLWLRKEKAHEIYSAHIELDLATVQACLAGPKRPQDRVSLDALGFATEKAILSQNHAGRVGKRAQVAERPFVLTNGDVVIAAITSCTNTSNPSVLIAAALMAKRALAMGVKIKPWVKASFAPGSKVVVSYLKKLGLLEPLEQLGFYVVGFGCTTCIGNSGPLDPEISRCIHENDLSVSAVLSGNRNFEGRIHPDVTMNWLASPPLVVAYAIAGTTKINLRRDALWQESSGGKVYLHDLWPEQKEIDALQCQISACMFTDAYQDLLVGSEQWEQLPVEKSATYTWQTGSTYIQRPDFFRHVDQLGHQDVKQARILAWLGDSVTTDHISPAGFIPPHSPAGRYLIEKQVDKKDFNSYGARRGNHQVMARGTFANIRLKNLCVENLLGGFTTHWPTEEVVPIYEAAQRYKKEGTDLVVIAGKEYGTGSSRDWAAKGTMMLGVRAVIAESFERIHRSNLIGMGVLPCQLVEHVVADLKLQGDEYIDIEGIDEMSEKRCMLQLGIKFADGRTIKVPMIARLDTDQEYVYYQNHGVLSHVLREMKAKSST